MFSWKPIYRELAHAILPYRNRQGELIDILRSLEAKGFKVVSLSDKDAHDNTVPLSVIDPFTFYANFNRGIKFESRRGILAELKTTFGLAADVPSDFDGIPVVNMMKARFFPYGSERRPDDIDDLWSLAEQCVKTEPEQLEGGLFDRCLNIRMVGAAKLTMGLFWLNPEQYLPLDSKTLSFIEDSGVKLPQKKARNLEDYLRDLEVVRESINDDFIALSREAYVSSGLPETSKEMVDQGFRTLLERIAAEHRTSVKAVAQALLHRDLGGGESEVTNRSRVLSALQKVLQERDIKIEQIGKALEGFWVIQGRTGPIRMNTFLTSDVATEAVNELLEVESGPPSADQIDDFIEAAIQHGYQDNEGRPDASGAAQFASVLLSARFPEQFVDFRANRWNTLYQLVTGRQEKLCQDDSYGLQIIRAGNFAAKLANTPTFITYFGKEHAVWKTAGLAWSFKQGVPELQVEPVPSGDKNGGIVPSKAATAIPLNQILYGPPGTGKTYRLNEHVAAHFTTQGAVKGKQQFLQELVSTMSWWHVITVTLLDLGSAKVPQIDSHELLRAKDAIMAQQNSRAMIWSMLQSHTVRECANVKYSKRLEPLLFHKDEEGNWSADRRLVENEAPELIELHRKVSQYEEQQETIRRYQFVTFHQSYAYEDFVEGIRPIVSEGEAGGALAYEVQDGIFKNMVAQASRDPQNNYALFIDEINRANIST